MYRYKDGKEIYKGSRKYHVDYNPMAHMASLTIIHPDSSDSGRYKLEAINEIGRVDTTGRVTINGKPNLCISPNVIFLRRWNHY